LAQIYKQVAPNGAFQQSYFQSVRHSGLPVRWTNIRGQDVRQERRLPALPAG